MENVTPLVGVMEIAVIGGLALFTLDKMLPEMKFPEADNKKVGWVV